MKKIFAGLAIVVLLLICGLFIYVSTIDGDDITAMLEDQLGDDFRVEIDRASVSLMRFAVDIENITITHQPEDHLLLSASSLKMSGLSLASLLRKNLVIRSFSADDFLVDWNDSLFGKEGDGNADSDSDSDEKPALDKAVIRGFDLRNGTLILRDDGEERHRYNQIDFRGGFAFSLLDGSFSRLERDNSIRVDTLGFYLSADRYQFSLKDFRFSQEDGTSTLKSMSLIPVGGYEQYMSSVEYRTDMYEIDLQNLRVIGIDDLAFLYDGTIIADSVYAEDFTIGVSSNLKLEINPERGDPKLLNRMVQDLPYHFKVGIITVGKGNVSYSEEAEDGVRPGTVRFSNTTAYVRNIDTRSSEPAVLTAVTYFQNHAELNTELRFTLSDEPFRMKGSGSLNPFDLKQLNSVFKDIEGIEITDGKAHEVQFSFEMQNNQATGNMRIVYEDLKIKPINKDDYSSSTRGNIVGFLANEIALRSNNMPDSNGEVKEGKISHERDPEEDPFFKYLWQTLRSGIFDILIRGI
ncbi:MAG: hypothetical protein LAT67_12215 [Balneolales bacterium]|nr:hypothetical protein [Balneolales bacterium]